MNFRFYGFLVLKTNRYMQGTDKNVLKVPSLLLTHVHFRGVPALAYTGYPILLYVTHY